MVMKNEKTQLIYDLIVRDAGRFSRCLSARSLAEARHTSDHEADSCLLVTLANSSKIPSTSHNSRKLTLTLAITVIDDKFFTPEDLRWRTPSYVCFNSLPPDSYQYIAPHSAKKSHHHHPLQKNHPNFLSNFFNIPVTPLSTLPAFSSNLPLTSFLGPYLATASPSAGLYACW